MQIRPYLTFKGECQEAINLYSEAFKTEVTQILRLKDVPQNPANPFPVPEDKKDWVIQATIPFGDNFIRVSDCMTELNDAQSERISIAVECEIELVQHAFDILAKEGNIGIALAETFFSPLHGVVFDKFGVMWNFVALKK